MKHQIIIKIPRLNRMKSPLQIQLPIKRKAKTKVLRRSNSNQQRKRRMEFLKRRLKANDK